MGEHVTSLSSPVSAGPIPRLCPLPFIAGQCDVVVARKTLQPGERKSGRLG